MLPENDIFKPSSLEFNGCIDSNHKIKIISGDKSHVNDAVDYWSSIKYQDDDLSLVVQKDDEHLFLTVRNFNYEFCDDYGVFVFDVVPYNDLSVVLVFMSKMAIDKLIAKYEMTTEKDFHQFLLNKHGL